MPLSDEPPLPGEPSSQPVPPASTAPVPPASTSPVPPASTTPVPEELLRELLALLGTMIDARIDQRLQDAYPNGMNTNDLVGYAIGSEERTDRLERIISNIAITSAIIVVAISGAYVVLSSDHHLFGGAISAVAAGIVGIAGAWLRIRRWLRIRNRRKAVDSSRSSTL